MRLTKKLAEQIDGIDLSSYAVGDVITLSKRDARMLIAEGWAVQERRSFAMGLLRVLAFRRHDDPGHLQRDDDVVPPS